MSELGRLIPVSLREFWSDESSEFTPWLAKEDNLKLLGDTIGIELEYEAQEKDVGSIRADILCKNTLDSSWVLIENQLEKTDHTHLGQLLTYAAGLEAVTIVWIAERFTDEHRATLDWLNEITDERFNFFGLEIQLWRIGSSPIAPKFNIISKPNDWSRIIQTSAGKATDISEHKQLQLSFWTSFKKYMEENSDIRCQKPAPQHWMNHSIGRTGFRLASVVSIWDSEANTKNPEIRVELVLDDDNSKKYFSLLQAQSHEIEKELGEPLKWHNPQDKRMCRIYLRRNDNFLDSSEWPKQHAWLQEKLEKFRKVFGPRIKSLDPAGFAMLSDSAEK
jgi:hypothetical protein